MSDRILREVLRPTEQRFQRIERQLGRLGQHAWSSGVLRAVSGSSLLEPSVPTALLNLEVTRGRWMVSYCGRVAFTAAGTESVFARIAVSSGTGTFPRFTWSIPNAGGAAIVPISGLAEFNSDEITTISLQGWLAGVTAATWSDLTLLALPV
jgi:hypothetical protein